MKPRDLREAGEPFSFFILFFAWYFDHIEHNFPVVLYFGAVFGQFSYKIPHLTSSSVTQHEAFHHIQQPATHLTT